jgi:adenosylcobinamide kinase/adenosylcobinamide-phosphate guanylyltransferase
MAHITMVTGGQRSGKSGYAQRKALELSESPVYVATARVWDDEFRQRVERHKADRGPQWTNIEEKKYISRHELSGRVVVVDCVTLWATNFFFDNDSNVDKSLAEMKEELERISKLDATFIFVTNEIGLGGVSPDSIQRKFTDLQGWFNQYLAQKSDNVIMMISGIPMTLK